MVRFLYSSFDALVLFQKISPYRDAGTFWFYCILYFTFYLRSDSSGLLWLLSTFLTLDILKTLVLVSAFSRSWRESKAVLMNFSFTKELSFFLLSISGMIGSRTDMYMVSVYLDKVQIAQYSVLLNFPIYLQAFEQFYFSTIYKNIYRINIQSTHGNFQDNYSEQVYLSRVLEFSSYGGFARIYLKYNFNLWWRWPAFSMYFLCFIICLRIYFHTKPERNNGFCMSTLEELFSTFFEFILASIIWNQWALMAATVVSISGLLMYSILEKLQRCCIWNVLGNRDSNRAGMLLRFSNWKLRMVLWNCILIHFADDWNFCWLRSGLEQKTLLFQRMNRHARLCVFRTFKKIWVQKKKSDVPRPQLSINKKLSVLEIGPWNGWLSKQIIGAGHRLVVVDYFRTPPYGLQTYKSDSPEYTKIQLDLHDLRTRWKVRFTDTQSLSSIFSGSNCIYRAVYSKVKQGEGKLFLYNRVTDISCSVKKFHRFRNKNLLQKRSITLICSFRPVKDIWILPILGRW